MTDLQTLVKQTSNPSILKMQQRLHDEVVTLGKQALKWKADYEALQLAFETERDAYAKAADAMAAAHKVERDALKDAARLALTALNRAVPKNARQASEQTEAIAALKAVL